MNILKFSPMKLSVYLAVFTLLSILLMSHLGSTIKDERILTRVAIRITSWNVAGKEPMGKLDGLFRDDERELFDDLDHASIRSSPYFNQPHIHVIGLQEAPHLSISNPKLLFSDPWTQNLTESLRPRGYILYKQHRLSGVFLYIFVRNDMLLNVRDFETESVKTGFGGLLGNKGGVSLRFTVNGNSFSVTNSHLAAHQEYLQQRIDDYNSIMDNTKYLIDSHTTNILTHDYSFWFGDLNFRLDNISKPEVLTALTSIRTTKSSSEKNTIIDRLLKHDQLNDVRRKGLAFREFNEATPRFLPTYKFVPGTIDIYDSEARTPAWTDRILYRHVPDAYYMMKNVSLDIDQIFYDSHRKFTQSDHKPISSMFTVVTFNPDIFNASLSPIKAIVKFEPINYWVVNKDGQVWYSISDEQFRQRPKVLSTWDRIGFYRADFASIDDYLTIVFNNNLARSSPSQDGVSIPYQETLSNSASSSRRSSTTSLANSTTSEPAAGRKYFTVIIPDDAILVPGRYKLLFLKATPSHELNVVGISDEFNVLPSSPS